MISVHETIFNAIQIFVSFQFSKYQFMLINYKKRYIFSDRDSIKSGTKLDTTFNFMPKDLVSIDYMAKEMNSIKLNEFINQSKARGISNLNTYLVELHKRTSLPISSYILTLLAVSMASKSVEVVWGLI